MHLGAVVECEPIIFSDFRNPLSHVISDSVFPRQKTLREFYLGKTEFDLRKTEFDLRKTESEMT